MDESVGEHTFARQLAPVRAEPRDDAEQVTQLLPGEPVTAEREGPWAQVTTAYRYPGWVRADDLGGDEDRAWIEPQGSDPVEQARSFLGSPYEWGGMTTAGIDCSGLVHMGFRATGRLVPRDADQQEAAGTPVSEEDLRPGDLISYGDPADHVAFWLGDGRILHSTRRDGVDGVVEEPEPAELKARRHALFRF